MAALNSGALGKTLTIAPPPRRIIGGHRGHQEVHPLQKVQVGDGNQDVDRGLSCKKVEVT